MMMMFKQLMMSAAPRHTALSLTRASFTSRVFVEGLPSEWTHHEIA